MDKKICVFDLDGTLAPIGKPIAPHDRELLLQIAQKGYRIVLCSGKPVYYLCGFARQLGLNEIILIGENGASIQFGVDLPPTQRYALPVSPQALTNMAQLKSLISEALGDSIWYQPNEYCLTPFPNRKEDFDTIAQIIASHPHLIHSLSVYRHSDSFDILPENINKYNALCLLSDILSVPRSAFISVGDGPNDYPMFAFSEISFGISLKDASKVTRNFTSITQALTAILEL